jgi:hypothetical protein
MTKRTKQAPPKKIVPVIISRGKAILRMIITAVATYPKKKKSIRDKVTVHLNPSAIETSLLILRPTAKDKSIMTAPISI